MNSKIKVWFLIVKIFNLKKSIYRKKDLPIYLFLFLSLDILRDCKCKLIRVKW